MEFCLQTLFSNSETALVVLLRAPESRRFLLQQRCKLCGDWGWEFPQHSLWKFYTHRTWEFYTHRTCGWISLTNPSNDRKTAAKSWNSISSPVQEHQSQKTSVALRAQQPFQSLRALIVWVTSNIICSQTLLSLNPLAPNTPYPAGPYCNFGEIHEYNRNHYYFKIYPYSTSAGLGNVV